MNIEFFKESCLLCNRKLHQYNAVGCSVYLSCAICYTTVFSWKYEVRDNTVKFVYNDIIFIFNLEDDEYVAIKMTQGQPEVTKLAKFNFSTKEELFEKLNFIINFS